MAGEIQENIYLEGKGPGYSEFNHQLGAWDGSTWERSERKGRPEHPLDGSGVNE